MSKEEKPSPEHSKKRARDPDDVMITFSNQEKLKKLPIPPLKETLHKFLHSVIKQIISDKEFLETQESIEEFLKGPGPELYENLKLYSETKNSYIEEFWDAAYLEYNAPVTVNVNPVFVLEEDPTPARSKLIPRAVSLVYSSLKFVRAIKKEVLSPDKVKDVPICMDQYKRLFSSARVPDPNGEDKDIVINSPNSTHVVVVCRGQFYYFQVLTTEFELAITERELTKNFDLIIADSEMNETKSRVGALTSENRTVWRRVRKELSQVSSNNKKVLEVIDSALFVICLDVDYEPDSVSNAAANILHGTLPNESNGKETMTSRWYDKLMLIVARGGTAGVNFEHSAFDGHTVLRYASDVFTDTIIRFAQTITGGIACPLDSNAYSRMMRPDLKPRRLEFDLTPSLERSIRYAESRLADLISQNHTTTLEFNGFGKNFLVQNALSPDATVQLGIQTAYYDIYGEVANTYESVLTKAYFHGRTEAGRSCTSEAVQFMKAFCGVHECSTDDKINLLRVAAKAHTSMTSDFAKGNGVDRLIYALESLWIKQNPGCPKPSLFTSPGWKALNNSILSTSNCGNPCLRFFGFGPVVPHGFGIGYIIKEDSIHFMITSKRRQTDRYRKTLEMFFEKIHDDLMSLAPVQPLSAIQLITFRSGSVTFDDTNKEEDSGYDFFGLNSKEIGERIGRELS